MLPVPLAFSAEDRGILPDRMIAALAKAGAILAEQRFVPEQIQPASLDLRLGSVAYRVRASFLPGKNARVEERLPELEMHKMDITEGAVLERGCVYIIPLLEGLALKKRTSAMGNPKSST